MTTIYARFIAWAARNLAWLAICATLLAGLVAQTLRIEGVNLWPIKVEGYKAANARLEADLQRVREGEARANELARQRKAEAEARYLELTRKTDEQLEQARASAMDHARAFIERNRLRPQASGGASGGTSAPASNSLAGSPDSASAAPLVGDPVIVEASDVLICTDAVLRLETVQAWGLGLAGAGELPPITAP